MKIKSLFWDSEMHQVYFKKHNATFRYANDRLQKICTNKYIMGHIQRCASPVRDWMNGAGSVRITGSLESLQFPVWQSLYKISTNTLADCELDRNRLAFQDSRKISIAQTWQMQRRWNGKQWWHFCPSQTNGDVLKAFHIYNPWTRKGDRG